MSRKSARLLLCGVFSVGLCLTGLVSRADTAVPRPADPSATIDQPRQRLAAPDFSLLDLDGRTLRLSDYQGKVVVLNFWATFCAPCRREMPALENLWRDYRNQGLVVVTVAADRGDPEIVRRYIEDGGYTFIVSLDPSGSVRKRYEVTAFPMTYLIGRDGRFRGRALGEREWDGPAIRTLLESLLAE